MLEAFYQRLLQSNRFADVRVAENIAAISAPATACRDNTVFIAPWRERALPNRRATGGHRQVVEEQYVTAVVIRQHGDPQGSERARRFQSAKDSIESLLAGWSPVEPGFVVSLVGGEADSLGNGVSIFAHTWQVSRFLTGAET